MLLIIPDPTLVMQSAYCQDTSTVLGTIHLKAAKHVLRYLKGNPGLGIKFSRQQKFSLEAYCDVDWAGDKQDQKSTIGYC